MAADIYETLGPDEELPAVLAINEAVGKLYGGKFAASWATIFGWKAGGPDPLDRVRCYRARDHWHYVGYGASDLDEDSFPDSPASGFGFELTFRLRGDEAEAPLWPAALLNSLVRYLYDNRTRFHAGEWFMFGRGWRESFGMPGVVFVHDPEVAPITTDYGEVEFLQIVGVSDDEMDRIKADPKTWDAIVDALRAADPLLVTTRAS